MITRKPGIRTIQYLRIMTANTAHYVIGVATNKCAFVAGDTDSVAGTVDVLAFTLIDQTITVDRMKIIVNTNSQDEDAVITIQIPVGTPGNLTATILAGVPGIYTDVTNQDVIPANSSCNYNIDNSSATMGGLGRDAISLRSTFTN